MGSDGTGLLWARVVAAVGIAGGLLAFIAGAYWARGFEDASRLFLLLQGVILSTLAFLFASQAADRAEQAVVTERHRRAAVESASSESAEDIAALRIALSDARAALDRLALDPDIGQKVDAMMRQSGE